MTKIALLSDIHVGKLGRGIDLSVNGESSQDTTRGGAPLISGLIDILNKEKTDYLFITGDLTSTGCPMEYSKFKDILEKIQQDTGINKDDTILSLGNHDFDRKIEAISESHEEKATSETSRRNIKEQYQKIAAITSTIFLSPNKFDTIGPAPFSGIINKGSLKIFILNSSWKSSQYDHSSHGELDKIQLDWFKDEAEKHKNSLEWKIILLHHHPYNYPYPVLSRDVTLLSEGSELLEIAGKFGFNLICHGHRHQPRAHSQIMSNWKNSITFICAGSFSVNASHRLAGDVPNCFHIIELVDDTHKILLLKTYQYKESTGWGKLEGYSKDTPLDHEMFFIKPYSTKDREKKLQEILDQNKDVNSFELPAWKELPLELRTIPQHDLNELLESICPLGKKIFGVYPEEVAILGENNNDKEG